MAEPPRFYRKADSLEQALWQRVSRGTEDECWPWQGSLTALGYGRLQHERQFHFAHRAMYQLLVGPIPTGLVLDHLCRNPRCVNPAHLEPVTDAVNVLRGVGPCALNALKTHCPAGHAYEGDNLVMFKGYRMCRECKRMHDRVNQQRRRERLAAAS